MYNDVTLEQINGKLTVTNQWLDQIYVQNESMIQNQMTLISGDIAIIKNQEYLINTNTALCCLLGLLIMFLFFIRSLL